MLVVQVFVHVKPDAIEAFKARASASDNYDRFLEIT